MLIPFTLNKPDWDPTFMRIAEEIATHSTCVRWNVGAVLVKDKRILSTGYNGVPSGLPHCKKYAFTMAENVCRGFRKELDCVAHNGFASGVSVDGFTEFMLTNKRYVISVEMFLNYIIEKNKGNSIDIKSVFSKLWDSYFAAGWMASMLLEKGMLNEWHSEWSEANEIHAEVNAIAWAARNGSDVTGSTMYVTLSPCVHCAKVILASGIKTVVFGGPDRSNKEDDGVKMLRDCGIEIKNVGGKQ